MTEIQPDGIVITVSQSTLKGLGYRNWLKEFLSTLSKENGVCFRRGNPKMEVLYVYICVGGKVRFRTNFVMVDSNRRIILSGPVVRPPKKQEPIMKGFQGFRYTQKLF